ncbi:hypothetical protein AC579_2071 [Pseudocercospora musae]|uniref:Uncharacterized protein n=1 Tax=Pseudocercospora musae TaxID=113226 RepID=A0A139GUW1_9PEZI|nr:hypothetical protein AC579_2071 [Pseudocercospora musae]
MSIRAMKLFSIDLETCCGCGSSSYIDPGTKDEMFCRGFLIKAVYTKRFRGRKLQEGFLKLWNILACAECRVDLELRKCMVKVWVRKSLASRGCLPTKNSELIDLTHDNKNTPTVDTVVCGTCLGEEDIAPNGFDNRHFTSCSKCEKPLHLRCHSSLCASASTDVTIEALLVLSRKIRRAIVEEPV